MQFQSNRVINRLALPITRACNRTCPECPAREREGIYGGSPREPHVPVSELLWVGKTLGPIEKIEVTGGEPSLHPDFKWISESIHHMFKCNDIMLLTNGFLFKEPRYLPILLNYDRVYVSHYTQKFADKYGGPTNTDVVGAIKEYLDSKPLRPLDRPPVQFWEQIMEYHNEFVRDGYGGNHCYYGYDKGDMVSYHRGQIYGCCTAWELDNPGRGILLTPNWRERLNEIDLPCDKCFLGAR